MSPDNDEVPRWLEAAMREDAAELPGAADNPRVLEYLKTVQVFGADGKPLPHDKLHDSIAWCSAFVQWSFGEVGVRGTGKANARSWLRWGSELPEPRLGCVAVFSDNARGPDAGHVAFYVGESLSPKHIHVFGGNQQNKVCLEPYPRARLLGYRWPTVFESILRR